ncbi:MAG: SUF system Fe-S cluster assembly protein [Pseudomonadota bacterium]
MDESQKLTADVQPEATDAQQATLVDRSAADRKDVADVSDAAEASKFSQEELEQLTADLVAAIKTVYDPEIPADIYELGLIYKIDLDDNRHVTVDMTLTAPGCPVAGEMPIWVENAVNTVPGVSGATVNLTFDPPWDMGRMSDEAKLALNMF